MAGPRSLNVVSVTLFLLLAAGVYGSYVYVPILWKRNELETLVKEEGYGAKRKTADELRVAILTSARENLGIELPLEDIDVQKLDDRAIVVVTWHVVVRFPLDYVARHNFRIRKEAVFY